MGNLRESMAQSPRGAGVLAALLMLATVAAFSGEVQTLDDNSPGRELGASLLNSTNATEAAKEIKPKEIKEPEEKKPTTAEEAELESYKQKVRETEKEKGEDPTDGEVTRMAQQLMELDKASTKSSREREIEESLRRDGPKETRVEVDPKQWEADAEERKKRAEAKREEEEREQQRKEEMENARANEAQAVKDMLLRYTHETMDPALEEKIQAATNGLKQASALEKRLKPSPDGPDPYGIHDRASWSGAAKANSTAAKAEAGSEGGDSY